MRKETYKLFIFLIQIKKHTNYLIFNIFNTNYIKQNNIHNNEKPYNLFNFVI